MSKALDALEDLMCVYFDNDHLKRKYGITEETAKEKVKVVKKALKALEVIKAMYDCKADITKIISDVEESEGFEEFSAMYGSFTKEMYDLLMEAFE